MGFPPCSSSTRPAKFFLPKFLEEESFNAIHDDDFSFLKAKPVLQQWADCAEKGQLFQKETKLDSEFIQHIFDAALGYKSIIEGPDSYRRPTHPLRPFNRD